MANASGAIAGVLGAYLVYFPHSRVRVMFFLYFIIRVISVPAVVVIGVWIVFQLIAGFGSLAYMDDASGGIAAVPQESSTETQGWNIGLRQTLFRWDQIVGLKQAGKIVAKAEADREAAQQDLIIRVSARYFEVLAAEDRLTSIHADRLAIARQLEQAKQRFEVGLIAITDVQESQAAYDSSVASEIQAKRELATARNFLREITGEYVSTLSAPGEKFPLPNPNPADQQSWIDLAMGQNLALVSSRLDEQIARDEIAFRRTGHYPTVDFVAGYADSDSTITDQVRNGVPPANAATPTVARAGGSSWGKKVP